MRQIAEVIRYAHEKELFIAACAPKVYWYLQPLAARESRFSLASRVSYCVDHRRFIRCCERYLPRRSIGGRYCDRYMGPESLTDQSIDDEESGEHLDVFSLGAIAYHIFSGVAPAAMHWS